MFLIFGKFRGSFFIVSLRRIKVEGKRDKAEGLDANTNTDKAEGSDAYKNTNKGFDHPRYGAWKKSRYLKIFLVLALITEGQNTDTDGEGLSLRSCLGQGLSLGSQSLKV